MKSYRPYSKKTCNVHKKINIFHPVNGNIASNTIIVDVNNTKILCVIAVSEIILFVEE